MDLWTFLWLMLFLKIPIGGLLGIVWWAVHQKPDEAPVTDDDGGIRPRPKPRHPHRPRPLSPRPTRRGPHGGQLPLPPARVRTAVARARPVER